LTVTEKSFRRIETAHQGRCNCKTIDSGRSISKHAIVLFGQHSHDPSLSIRRAMEWKERKKQHVFSCAILAHTHTFFGSKVTTRKSNKSRYQNKVRSQMRLPHAVANQNNRKSFCQSLGRRSFHETSRLNLCEPGYQQDHRNLQDDVQSLSTLG